MHFGRVRVLQRAFTLTMQWSRFVTKTILGGPQGYPAHGNGTLPDKCVFELS